ncbi:4a-hydroxytetrahydrobiopterin dehydratase [Mumia flava]|uniref:Putative pterin-4-alpha-carbinolamine dehydratase n=1 Tax=Mumia flava TaxID=1348852 RepID=A0A0B2B791_9ACTN|nr:4a-hydroxytetrahydrobiopterin dehydratase [Mumia flava]PJJ56734.1 4a-hydroxytetrahydrobiopterin dehydratase [Mumia flava]
MTAADDLLSESEISDGLASLPGWIREGDTLMRSVRASSFLGGIDLVNAVARAAEDANHHPDITIRWRELTFALSTHSAGGLTAKDLAMASRIDRIVEAGESTD